MSAIADKLRRWLGRDVAPTIRVHILLRGRIGEGWYDIDRQLKVPMGTTLGQLIDSGEERGIPLAEALARSPHLVHTLMLNGERCPVADNRERPLEDGDQIYLLAPLAGG
ncbi:MAG: MoaD/ThiS family protein [Proteobacteria bacterium]|nr:MoaD/ThiS family protein [Pseudomonadota bacterium]